MNKTLAIITCMVLILSISLNVFLIRNNILRTIAIGEWFDDVLSTEESAYTFLMWNNLDKAKEVLHTSIREKQLQIYNCDDEACLEKLGIHADRSRP